MSYLVINPNEIGRAVVGTFVLNTLGGVQIKTGGGKVYAPVVVKSAGSLDCVLTLYDGTGTDGGVIAVLGCGIAGAVMLPNVTFGAGLYAEMTGTTACSAEMCFQ